MGLEDNGRVVVVNGHLNNTVGVYVVKQRRMAFVESRSSTCSVFTPPSASVAHDGTPPLAAADARSGRERLPFACWRRRARIGWQQLPCGWLAQPAVSAQAGVGSAAAAAAMKMTRRRRRRRRRRRHRRWAALRRATHRRWPRRPCRCLRRAAAPPRLLPWAPSAWQLAPAAVPAAVPVSMPVHRHPHSLSQHGRARGAARRAAPRRPRPLLRLPAWPGCGPGQPTAAAPRHRSRPTHRRRRPL
jgi:hypothetical protein